MKALKFADAYSSAHSWAIDLVLKVNTLGHSIWLGCNIKRVKKKIAISFYTHAIKLKLKVSSCKNCVYIDPMGNNSKHLSSG